MTRWNCDIRPATVNAGRQHCLSFAVCCCVALQLAGCHWLGKRDPFGPCEFAADVPLPVLISRMNENVRLVKSWRSTHVHVRGPHGLPVTTSANIAVEAPRNFRLVVNSPFGGKEADLGSNDERFWFWFRENGDGRLIMARHEDTQELAQRLPIPFDPEWLMAVLGVVEFPPGEFVLEDAVDPSRVRLVSQTVAPTGEPMRRVVVVDTCHALVHEHALVGGDGRLVARAELMGHYRDTLTGAILPRSIRLEWPETRLQLVLRFDNVEVNVPSSSQMFAPPAGAVHGASPN